MTRMKDSGIEWIGEVPEDWGITKLKYICRMQSGNNLTSLEISSENDGGKIFPVYGGNGQRGYYSDFTNEGNYCLVGRQGALAGNVHFVSGKFWATDHAIVVYEHTHTYSKYLCYLLKAMNLNQYAFETSAQPGLSVEKILQLEMIHCPKGEQTQIADFLDKKVAQLDKIKSLLEEQIKTLEDYRKSLIYETVTKGLDKTVPLKDSGVDWIGQIPEGWGVGKLKYYFDVQLGKMLQPSAINGNDIEIDYLRAINVQWDNISVDNLSKMWCNPSEVSKYEIMNGDLLVCEGGEVGRCGIVEYLSDRAIIQNAVHRIRSAERANVRFLNYYIQHTTKSKWFDILCNKATIAHLTSEKLLNTLVVLPSISEQIQIADFLDKKTEQINQMIAIKKEQIENINKQRQTLIYDVVTGKRRV